MPAATVLDWSGWRPTNVQLQLMRGLGIVGVQRYETDDFPGNQWKVCSKAEYENLLLYGFQILAGFEVSKSSWRGGRAMGLKHGKMARDKWRAKGHPDSRPIAFAVDSDVPNTAADVNLAVEYLRACSDAGGCGPQMSYGETSVIDAAVDRGATSNAWRAAATGWDTSPSRHASLQQKVTKSYPQFPPDAQGNWPYDENVILKPDWGQHPAPHLGEIMGMPFTLHKDNSNPPKIWRVDAGGQSKILVPDLPAIGFNFDRLKEYGATAADLIVRDASTGEAKRWLDAIPDAATFNQLPPPPAPFDVAGLVNALNSDLGRRIVNG